MDIITPDTPLNTSSNHLAAPHLTVTITALLLVLSSAISADVGLAANPDCSWQPGFDTSAITGDVLALAVFDDGSGPALYAGGRFLTAAGIRTNFVAKWTGGSWSALGEPPHQGVDDPEFADVRALAVFDDGTGEALYVGGTFESAGGVTANNIARWDGTTWTAVGDPDQPGVSGSVRTLEVYDDGSGPALYVGGHFCQVGGQQVQGIARWVHGGSWSSLVALSQTGLSGCRVDALTRWNDGDGEALFIGGRFSSANGVPVNNLVRWDGSAWTPLISSLGNGLDSAVVALEPFDDATGPGLVAALFLDTTGSFNGVARWNGSEWSSLDGPAGIGLVLPSAAALLAFSTDGSRDLYTGGGFSYAGGVPSGFIARYACPPEREPVFRDGFESGDRSAWSQSLP